MVQHLWDEIGCPNLDLTGSRSKRFPWNRATKWKIWFQSTHHCLMETWVQSKEWFLISRSQFVKPRPIAEELNRLEWISVSEKVECSDWATPIVPVLKPDGTMRICGDYKITINPVMDVPQYPMPTGYGGQRFSKLDINKFCWMKNPGSMSRLSGCPANSGRVNFGSEKS